MKTAPPTEKNITLLRRLGVILYDGLLLFAVLFFASIPVVAGFSITYDSPFYPLYILYIYSIGFLYFGWFWTHGGQTLAMKTWKARLVSKQGEVTWLQAAKRYFAALISWLCLGLGFIWSLFRQDNATWHDLFSATRLVASNEGPNKSG